MIFLDESIFDGAPAPALDCGVMCAVSIAGGALLGGEVEGRPVDGWVMVRVAGAGTVRCHASRVWAVAA